MRGALWRGRNLLKRARGAGPFRRAPIETLCRIYSAADYRYGICGPERMAGRLGHFRAPAHLYRTPAKIGDFHIEQIGGSARFQNAFMATEHECAAFALPDAGIVGEEGVIYHVPTRTAVAETTAQWWTSGRQSPELATPGFPRATHRGGVAMCLRTRGAAAFYHFLIEGLSRLTLLKPWLDLADWLLITGPRTPWKESWLECAGLPLSKVIWTTGLTHLAFDHILFAGPFLKEQQPTAEHVARINALFPSPRPVEDDPARPILYVSRADAGRRVWAGELGFLDRNPSIQAVTLAGLPAQEQIARFAGARGIIAMHGSGLANLVFARPPFWVIETVQDGRFAPMFGRLTEAAGGDHVALALSGDAAQDERNISAALARFGL